MSADNETSTVAVLVEISRNLGAYIEQRAEELAQIAIGAAERSHRARIGELEHDAAAWEQRFEELRVEIARQARGRERSDRQAQRDAAAIRRVRTLQWRKGEGGRSFVFADELFAALLEPSPAPAPAAARSGGAR